MTDLSRPAASPKRTIRPGKIFLAIMAVITLGVLGEGIYEVVKAGPEQRFESATKDGVATTLRWLNGAVSRLGGRAQQTPDAPPASGFGGPFLAPDPGETRKLEAQVSDLRNRAAAVDRGRSPTTWVISQARLGGALAELGENTNNTEQIRQAVQSLRSALSLETGDPAIAARAATSLGHALVGLAKRESGTAQLEDALRAYRAAIAKWNRQERPLDWAEASAGMGLALGLLGQRRQAVSLLNEAAGAFLAAADIWTREERPAKWAELQFNLARTYLEIGRLGSERSVLDAALDAADQATDYYRETSAPALVAASETLRKEILGVRGE